MAFAASPARTAAACPLGRGEGAPDERLLMSLRRCVNACGIDVPRGLGTSTSCGGPTAPRTVLLPALRLRVFGIVRLPDRQRGGSRGEEADLGVPKEPAKGTGAVDQISRSQGAAARQERHGDNLQRRRGHERRRSGHGSTSGALRRSARSARAKSSAHFRDWSEKWDEGIKRCRARACCRSAQRPPRRNGKYGVYDPPRQNDQISR